MTLIRKKRLARVSPRRAADGPAFSTLARGKPIKKRNPERQAKRKAKYKAYLSSAAWKAKRQEVFARDGYRCVNRIPIDGWIDPFVVLVERCPNRDESRTGAGLICDHLTYARFGNENLDDLRTLCKACNARETMQTRANWMNR